MKLRLRTRLVLTTLSLVVAIVLSMSSAMMWQFNQSTESIRSLSTASITAELEARLKERGARTTAFLAETLSAPVARLDLLAIHSQLNRSSEQSDVVYAIVYDSEQLVVHDGTLDARDAGRTLTEVLAERRAEFPGSLYLVFQRPITQDGVTIGGLHMAFSRERLLEDSAATDAELIELIRDGERSNWFRAGVATTLFLLFGVLFALIFSRGIVSPIHRLAKYASAVGHGGFDQELDICRSDEIGDLAASLKEMTKNLQVTTGEVHYLAYHDSLTRLPNRAQLKQSLRQALSRARRGDKSVALLFIDLDDFKRVNDTLGHEAGDSLLKEFSMRLRDCLREGDQQVNGQAASEDLIARLGGDEFTVILENIDESADAAVVAQRILKECRKPFLLHGQEVVIGASIGVTTFPEDGHDVDTLLRNADVAMYQAKERGKNHFEYYNDSMHRMATERLSLETDLRHAIEYDQVRLLYQPVMDVATGTICGVEAVLRWMHPALGEIRPSVFMPLAEQTGFIVEIDEWVMRRATADLAQIHAQGLDDIKMHINLSSLHFHRQSIAGSLDRALEATGLEASHLVLEINEKTIMRNFPRASQLLKELRDRGVQVWIDNFGSGHSPLAQLTKIPVNGLKVAQDHVAQITNGDNEKAIIAAIVAMGHSLNLKVTASGVENAEQIEVLREVGCDHVQGSLYLRPIVLDDLITYLERNARGAVRLSQTGTFGSLAVVPPRS